MKWQKKKKPIGHNLGMSQCPETQKSWKQILWIAYKYDTHSFFINIIIIIIFNKDYFNGMILP